ncbi:hypothetical protein D9611_002665 [Ephemerocybe angulata]|uniref:Uncharacterized protein n=1 Tax=Ephemerocybe angulata TaxID=980116 RepID=A0A8H5C2Y4_9AGAR|nr:hypothetical protein D9611_002665 [Tulosesus angulatus]
MQAYALALNALKAGNPDRWAERSLQHEEMRNSFAWIYLKLRHGILDSRGTVGSRVSRLIQLDRRAAGKGKGEGPSTRQPTPEALDYDLAARLGVGEFLRKETRRFNSPSEVHRVEYAAVTGVDEEGEQRVQLCSDPISRPGAPGTTYTTAIAPSLLTARIDGNPFKGGTVVLSSPWMFSKMCTFRLKTLDGCLLNSLMVPVETPNRMQAFRLEQELPLRDNSVFLFNLVHSVLPEVQPTTTFLLIYTFDQGYDQFEGGRSRQIPVSVPFRARDLHSYVLPPAGGRQPSAFSGLPPPLSNIVSGEVGVHTEDTRDWNDARESQRIMTCANPIPCEGVPLLLSWAL